MPPASAVRDVIGSECIAELVELLQPVRFSVRGRNERQGAVAKLVQASFNVGDEFLAIPDFAVLPGGFEPGGMGEAARGKGGIGELPQEPLIE